MEVLEISTGKFFLCLRNPFEFFRRNVRSLAVSACGSFLEMPATSLNRPALRWMRTLRCMAVDT